MACADNSMSATFNDSVVTKWMMYWRPDANGTYLQLRWGGTKCKELLRAQKTCDIQSPFWPLVAQLKRQSTIALWKSGIGRCGRRRERERSQEWNRAKADQQGLWQNGKPCRKPMATTVVQKQWKGYDSVDLRLTAPHWVSCMGPWPSRSTQMILSTVKTLWRGTGGYMTRSEQHMRML